MHFEGRFPLPSLTLKVSSPLTRAGLTRAGFRPDKALHLTFEKDLSEFHTQQPANVANMSNFAGQQQPSGVNISDYVLNMPGFVSQGQTQPTTGSPVMNNITSDFVEQQQRQSPDSIISGGTRNFLAQQTQTASPNSSYNLTNYQQTQTVSPNSSYNMDMNSTPPEETPMSNYFNTNSTQVAGNQGYYSSSSSNDVQRAQVCFATMFNINI